jgi:hypothetical protein
VKNILFVFILFLSLDSFSHDEPMPEEDKSFFNFVVYFTDCSNSEASLFNSKTVSTDTLSGFMLACSSNYYFASCADSYKTKTSFNLKQNIGNQFLYENPLAIMIIDFNLKKSIFNQSSLSENSNFSNLLCKGVTIKDLNDKTPLFEINKGLDKIIKMIGEKNDIKQ